MCNGVASRLNDDTFWLGLEKLKDKKKINLKNLLKLKRNITKINTIIPIICQE